MWTSTSRSWIVRPSRITPVTPRSSAAATKPPRARPPPATISHASATTSGSAQHRSSRRRPRRPLSRASARAHLAMTRRNQFRSTSAMCRPGPATTWSTAAPRAERAAPIEVRTLHLHGDAVCAQVLDQRRPLVCQLRAAVARVVLLVHPHVGPHRGRRPATRFAAARLGVALGGVGRHGPRVRTARCQPGAAKPRSSGEGNGAGAGMGGAGDAAGCAAVGQAAGGGAARVPTYAPAPPGLRTSSRRRRSETTAARYASGGHPGGGGGVTYRVTSSAMCRPIVKRTAGSRSFVRERNCRAARARPSGSRDRSADAAHPAIAGGICAMGPGRSGTRSRTTTVPARKSPTRLPFTEARLVRIAMTPNVSQISMTPTRARTRECRNRTDPPSSRTTRSPMASFPSERPRVSVSNISG